METNETAEPRVIDGYKRDTRARFVRAMVPGLLCALVGAAMLHVGTRELVARDPAAIYASRPTSQILRKVREAPADESTWLTLGTLLCLASPIVMALSLRRSIEADDYLLLRTDGLVHQSGGRALLFPWEDVDRVRFDEATDTLVVVMLDGAEFPIPERYLGAAPRELAMRVADFRRKAMWNLLPSQRRRR